MMRAVFEKRQQILGEDYPDTLSYMNNLAGTLGDVGELQEALSMMREFLHFSSKDPRKVDPIAVGILKHPVG